RIRQTVEALAPRVRDKLAIQDQAVGAVDWQRHDAQLLAQTDHRALPLRRVGGAGGECLPRVLFQVCVACSPCSSSSESLLWCSKRWAQGARRFVMTSLKNSSFGPLG